MIRNRKQRPAPADNVFRVRAGVDRLDAAVDGRTEIAVENGRITIDVTGAKVKVIQLKQTRVMASNVEPTGVALWWHNGLSRWDAGYDRSPYKPFMLARWAYADLILTAVFLIAQFFNYFFGPTGANIIWGNQFEKSESRKVSIGGKPDAVAAIVDCRAAWKLGPACAAVGVQRVLRAKWIRMGIGAGRNCLSWGRTDGSGLSTLR